MLTGIMQFIQDVLFLLQVLQLTRYVMICDLKVQNQRDKLPGTEMPKYLTTSETMVFLSRRRVFHTVVSTGLYEILRLPASERSMASDVQNWSMDTPCFLLRFSSNRTDFRKYILQLSWNQDTFL
jgi:hypothetical protein